MNIIPTQLEGCFIIEPAVYPDSRGYFFESFNEAGFNEKTGLDVHFVQDNQSLSTYGVLRGLHFQQGSYAQAKLVRAIKGTVLDVAVDLRAGSTTFGQHVSVLLSAENKRQLFVPRGFAHGFAVLSPEAEFFYKCDNYYNKASEGSLLYSDADLAIDWQLPAGDILVSEKDQVNATFQTFKERLTR
ncbi:dTDP-4-dehydrorhamnose 3,5-epimerase [Arcticibacter svalbardensis MN12-7]|uniref:dTDP-4-dehydrorhamnose 3,5-epimerase n=1 Tax=Arcticibacter svalbardensis MN12-7 TaxID=1150600 RepID=R9GM30_9SPHI|nr:dTDP-4-dehydrorhamnose 3,5-epimerase [Arcticibacter svalbardensis]EOR92892.1 dTDP-4-dehydrorhamnose 3,5-epimerase [Arcticibacter svalbardensis MN12-7]